MVFPDVAHALLWKAAASLMMHVSYAKVYKKRSGADEFKGL